MQIRSQENKEKRVLDVLAKNLSRILTIKDPKIKKEQVKLLKSKI